MQEIKYKVYVLRRQLGILAILLAFAGVVYLLTGETRPAPATAVALGERIRTGEAPVPELTAKTAAQLAASNGFQVLVSYTDTGFEPALVTIKAGETVRFTNNSSSDVWIAADGTSVQIYPRTKEVCGSSDLDSCEPFAPQDFWEFTFEVPGEWGIINNVNKTRQGIIEVL